MATNFGTGAVEAPVLQSAAPVLEGVAKLAPSNSIINDVFNSVSGIFEAKAAAKKDSVIADFIKRQGLIADGLDQGSIPNSAYARTMSRKVLLDAIDANPGMAKDFMEAQSKFMGLTGGGDIIHDGSDEEQAWKARRASLVDSGMLAPDASDTQLKIASAEVERMAALKKTYDIRMQTLEMESKTLSLDASRRAANEAEQQKVAYDFVQQVAPSELMRVKTAMDAILTSPTTPTEKQQSIEEFWSQFLSEATALGMKLKSDDRSVFMKPFENMKTDYLKRATGEYTDAELKANIDRSINTQKALLLADPEIARTVATTELIKNDIIMNAYTSTNSPVTKKIMNLMAYGSPTAPLEKQPSPLATDADEKVALRTTLSAIGNSWLNGDVNAKKEMVERTQRILSSVLDTQNAIAKNPKTANELVRWFASGDFQKMTTANPDLLKDTQAAKEALGRNYEDEVMGMINREFVKNNVSGLIMNKDQIKNRADIFIQSQKQYKTTDLVTTEATALGMQFVPINPKNQEAINIALDLNKNLRPIINMQIRAGAHLDGRTDYGTYWEEAAAKFLDTDVGSDPGDDISLEDFLQKGALDTAMSTGGYVGNGDFSQAETPADVAASFVGFKEGTERDVLSSFIEKTTGGKIDPASTAWCAAFVNAAFGAKGVQGTGQLSARSFLDWGTPTTSPAKGDVVVLWRDSPDSGKGHVGFYIGPSEKKGYIKILGGNQGRDGRVSIEEYPMQRVLGFRQPSLPIG